MLYARGEKDSMGMVHMPSRFDDNEDNQEYLLQRAAAPLTFLRYLPFNRPENITWDKSRKKWQVGSASALEEATRRAAAAGVNARFYLCDVGRRRCRSQRHETKAGISLTLNASVVSGSGHHRRGDAPLVG